MFEAERDRADLAEMLRDLSPREWETPSLCQGWTVREVVAHVLSYEGLTAREVLSRALRGRFTFVGMNAVGLADSSELSGADLVDRLERYPRPTGLTAARGGAVGMVDGLIHQQDIRRPLARPRDIPHARLRYALGFAVTAPPLRGFWHVRGVRVVATDVDWAHGRGPEARGTAEAVLMTLAGRRGVSRELDGPGSAKLQQRLG